MSGLYTDVFTDDIFYHCKLNILWVLDYGLWAIKNKHTDVA